MVAREGAVDRCVEAHSGLDGLSPVGIVAPTDDAAQFDSEALWSLVAGWRWSARPVWIVRGNGGRDWLGAQLREAGDETVIAYSIDSMLAGKLGSIGQPVLKAKAKEMEKKFTERLRAEFAAGETQ